MDMESQPWGSSGALQKARVSWGAASLPKREGPVWWVAKSKGSPCPENPQSDGHSQPFLGEEPGDRALQALLVFPGCSTLVIFQTLSKLSSSRVHAHTRTFGMCLSAGSQHLYAPLPGTRADCCTASLLTPALSLKFMGCMPACQTGDPSGQAWGSLGTNPGGIYCTLWLCWACPCSPFPQPQLTGASPGRSPKQDLLFRN